jgi:hypothetical protein
VSKKDLLLIDYVGHSNENDEPIGHVLKYINEYSIILKNLFSIKLIVPKIYKNKIKLNNISFLNKHCKNHNNHIKIKLKNLYYRFYNLFKIFIYSKEDDLWFVNVEWVFFMFLFFFPTKKNIYITMYRQNFNSEKNSLNKLKDYFFYKSLKKINGIIATNPNINFDNIDVLYIPDYFYKKEIYKKYINIEKKEQVVLLGRISHEKEIKKTVDLFKNKEIDLKIIGDFEDVDLYNKLQKNKSDNIIIENRYLSQNEYYNLMAESRYIILPYKKEIYSNKTSGVLIESMFLNTIAIAPDFLLEYNQIPGISYSSINDIYSYNFEKIDFQSFYKIYSKKRENRFSFNKIKTKLKNFLTK